MSKDRHRRDRIMAGPVAAPGSDRTIRASDQEREAVVQALGEHTSAGRLTMAEFEERAGSAYAAQTLADLDVLTQDLPAVRTPPPVQTPQRGWARVEPWSRWLSVSLICTAIYLVSSMASGRLYFFWPFWVIVPWGISMLFRVGLPYRRR